MSHNFGSMVGDKLAATSCDGQNMSGLVVNICLITEVWFNEKNSVMCCLNDVCYWQCSFCFILPNIETGCHQ
jgi:hypothetical protein